MRHRAPDLLPVALAALLLLPGCIGTAAAQGRPAADLSVSIVNLRDDRGHVGLMLFDSGHGFPDDRAHAVREAYLEARGRRASHTFEGLPPGTYAAAVLHDENNNETIDTNWMGVPTEGFGTSNNPKVRFGPPTWGDAKFAHGPEGTSIVIKVRYF